MRPLLGVVTRADRASVLVRLESGLLVNTTNDLGLERFDTVAVRYDYTTNSIVGIEKHDPDAKAKENDVDECDMVILDCSEEYEVPLEPLDAEHSGALFPDCVGCWSPEEGVLLMEGDSSIE